MTTITPRGSARIYAFVPRADMATKDKRSEQTPGGDRSATHRHVCEFGGGWYHDDAIRDADRPRKS